MLKNAPMRYSVRICDWRKDRERSVALRCKVSQRRQSPLVRTASDCDDGRPLKAHLLVVKRRRNAFPLEREGECDARAKLRVYDNMHASFCGAGTSLESMDARSQPSFGTTAGSDIELADALCSVLDGVSSSLVILLPRTVRCALFLGLADPLLGSCDALLGDSVLLPESNC